MHSNDSLDREYLMKLLIVQLTLVMLATAGCKDNPGRPATSTSAFDSAPAIVTGKIPTKLEKSSLLAAIHKIKRPVFQKASCAVGSG
jgi:hypothetical protein